MIFLIPHYYHYPTLNIYQFNIFNTNVGFCNNKFILIQAGAFRIGDTAGTLENIVACKLYRPGSVGFVSKSGGMSNEMYNVLSRATNGLYEGMLCLPNMVSLAASGFERLVNDMLCCECAGP